MLGFTDGGVIAAYLLSIASALLCVIWGIVNWEKE